MVNGYRTKLTIDAARRCSVHPPRQAIMDVLDEKLNVPTVMEVDEPVSVRDRESFVLVQGLACPWVLISTLYDQQTRLSPPSICQTSVMK